MTRKIKLLIIAGARPNFMKVAPLIKSVLARAANGKQNGVSVEYRLVHTGQHYDEKMSGIFFGELGIPAPDINLDVGSGSHAVQTANLLAKFEPVCESEKPDWVVVVGLGDRFQIWNRDAFQAHRAAQREVAREGLATLRAQQRAAKLGSAG